MGFVRAVAVAAWATVGLLVAGAATAAPAAKEVRLYVLD